jgi:hypothetical protein
MVCRIWIAFLVYSLHKNSGTEAYVSLMIFYKPCNCNGSQTVTGFTETVAWLTSVTHKVHHKQATCVVPYETHTCENYLHHMLETKWLNGNLRTGYEKCIKRVKIVMNSSCVWSGKPFEVVNIHHLGKFFTDLFCLFQENVDVNRFCCIC